MTFADDDKQQPQKRGRLKNGDNPKTKKQRLLADTATHGTSAYPNFLLNSDISSEIFSFLDIRSLYNVTMTSKEGMKLLRHEHVVRSAMMQGGHSKTSMERLVPLIENRCIWIPSPLRMLRLMNGRTCERCCQGRVHLVSDSYGVFFCFQGCIQDISTKGVAFNNKWSPFVVGQPRIAKAAYSSSAYIWIRPYTDASGERCGPLMSMVEMERIMQGDGTVEKLLKEKDAMDPYANDATISEITKVFKDTTEAAARRIQERKQMKVKASVNANDRRKTKLIAMIDTLHVELDDVPWKDTALAHQWRKSSSKEIPVFACALTNDLLREYNSAPSKATKKKLRGIAQSLRRSFRIMEKKGFHDYSFLSDSCPVEKAVKDHCKEHYPTYKLLESRWMNDQALKHIQSASHSDLFKDLLSLLPTNLGSILAPVIVSSTVAIQSDEMREKAFQQALLLSAVELGGSSAIYWTRIDRNPPMTPLQLYTTLLEKFPRLFQNTLDFLDAPETRAWKEEHSREGFGRYADPVVAMERLNSRVNDVWSGPMACQEPLLQRDFNAVLKILWDLELQMA